MSLEELGQLFPIDLSPYNPLWIEWAEDEIELLGNLLAGHGAVINHIGSTAIPGIYAKPIIDILVEIPDPADLDLIVGILESRGYILMNRSTDRLSFNKGYTLSGYADKVFHIHVHIAGDNDEILFRDYLRSHPTDRFEYESLKQSLLPQYRQDRDGYTERKTAFVRNIVGKARRNEK